MARTRKAQPAGGARDRDPEVREAASAFLHELPGRIGAFEQLWSQHRLEDLLREARNLAVVGAGMGYSEVAAAAGSLGHSLSQLVHGQGKAGSVQALRREFGKVVHVCRGMARTGGKGLDEER